MVLIESTQFDSDSHLGCRHEGAKHIYLNVIQMQNWGLLNCCGAVCVHVEKWLIKLVLVAFQEFISSLCSASSPPGRMGVEICITMCCNFPHKSVRTLPHISRHLNVCSTADLIYSILSAAFACKDVWKLGNVLIGFVAGDNIRP